MSFPEAYPHPRSTRRIAERLQEIVDMHTVQGSFLAEEARQLIVALSDRALLLEEVPVGALKELDGYERL